MFELTKTVIVKANEITKVDAVLQLSKENLNVRQVEDWPVEKINYVPNGLKEKLIPPIKNLFASFKSNLDRKNSLS